MIRVGVVAENMAMRLGLREVLNNLPEISVVVTSTQLEDLAAEILDVLVVIPPANLDVLRNDFSVLFLTDDPAEVQELYSLGFTAWGALSVNASENELDIAIKALAEGLWISAPNLVQKWFPRKQPFELSDTESSHPALTVRETEVLQLAAQGLANKQIAARLGISEHTIKFHLSALYAKLGVSSRTEAVRTGVRCGLVVL